MTEAKRPTTSGDPDLMDYEDCRPTPNDAPPLLDDVPDYIIQAVGRRRQIQP
jgi:hypothetical protein